jgi:hypothetical protein
LKYGAVVEVPAVDAAACKVVAPDLVGMQLSHVQ